MGTGTRETATLGSSEKLLQRVRGMVSIHVILVKGEYMHQAQIFFCIRFLMES